MRENCEAAESKQTGEPSTEKMLDKTLADSFPTSDPPSTIPNPGDGSASRDDAADVRLAGLTPGSWAAVCIDSGEVVATGASREGAESTARRRGHGKFSLVQVPSTTDGTVAA
jgi:hypothetical protein